tara:strand:- start:389 stop:1180 length:792 start_codon:yes stop_codon:yes gene_type:complete
LTDIEVFKQVTDIATLDESQIAKITSRLPEYKRGKVMIGHGTSQTSYSLQSMQMISDSPLSRMKQCLAQIDKKYKAIQESYYAMENKKLIIEKLKGKTDSHSRLTVQEYSSQVESITLLMNTALREIGMFQDMYDGIKKNNNIPDDWSEKDYELQEISHMVKASFRLAIQDLSSGGRVSKAAVEYWEQLGIHPQLAESKTRSYLMIIQEKVNRLEKVTIRDMYDFLDEMAQEFKDSYKDALSRMGLDELGSEEFMAKGHTRPQ